MYFSILNLHAYIFPSFKTFYKSQRTKKCRTSLFNSSAMQVLLVGKISAVFDPFLSGFLSVIRKEFEVPPYSQSVELGSQIQLRCHPPKGVPTPRVSAKSLHIEKSCGGKFLWNRIWDLGWIWVSWHFWKKPFGPIMSNFWGGFFQVFVVKKDKYIKTL